MAATEPIIDVEFKEHKFLTRVSESSGAMYNIGDPDRLLMYKLPFLELTAALTIRHGGIVRGKKSWYGCKWTERLSRILESSEIGSNILTIDANSDETHVVLDSPVVVENLFANEIRIRVTKPKPLEFPFYRTTPPLSPNLDRYGVTIHDLHVVFDLVVKPELFG